MDHLLKMISGGTTTAAAATTEAVVVTPPTTDMSPPSKVRNIRKHTTKDNNNNDDDANDRSHPNLQALDALHLTYPGYERDKREAEAVHLGKSGLNLGFDAALRRLKVKQRAHEEQRSIRSIHRSHPNLVALDSLKLTYPGWKTDFSMAEKAHNEDPNCDFTTGVLRKLQIKQYKHENDRDHYRLREIDSLKLSYPGWKADIRNLEKFHFEEAFFLPGDSLFQSKIDGLKRRQQIFLRSQKFRGNRASMKNELLEEEEIETDAATDATIGKGCYAVLLGNDHEKGNEENPTYEDESVSEEEERTDRQPLRTPYAIIADIGGHSSRRPSGRDPDENPLLSYLPSRGSGAVDPSSSDNNYRPDPPDSAAAKTGARERIDCDAPVVGGGGNGHGHGTSTSELEPLQRSDPQGASTPTRSDSTVVVQQQRKQPPVQWPNKLSSYIDVDAMDDDDDDNDDDDHFLKGSIGTRKDESQYHREAEDDVPDLPPSSSSNRRYSAPTTSKYYATTYKNRRKAPKGKYSAPPLFPSDDDISMASRALSELTTSSSRAVWSDERSSAGISHSSSQAVWVEQPSVASATSSRAVYEESPRSYVPQTPSSMQVVHSVQGDSSRKGAMHGVYPQRPLDIMRMSSSVTPAPMLEVREKQNLLRLKKASQEKSRKYRRGDDRSRVSRDSRASSLSSAKTKKLGRCTICGDNDKNHVFVPCGHLCACKECAGQVLTRKMTCPVCRGGVTEAIQVFL